MQDAKLREELGEQADKLEHHRKNYVEHKRRGPRPSSAYRLRRQPHNAFRDPSKSRIAPGELLRVFVAVAVFASIS